MPDTGAGAGGATVAGFGGSGCLPQLASKHAQKTFKSNFFIAAS